MTNREAIERIRKTMQNLKYLYLVGAVEHDDISEHLEAYELAIKALEAQMEWQEATKGADDDKCKRNV